MAKRRFTWLDGVIIGVLVLAVAAVAVWYFTKDNGAALVAENKEYEVTLRFNRATEDEFDYYRVGDTMYYQDRVAPLGTITALKAVENLTEKYDPVTGTYVALQENASGAVEMKVRVQGAVVNGDFTVSGWNVYIGEVFFPQSDTTRSIVTVWDIEEVTA